MLPLYFKLYAVMNKTPIIHIVFHLRRKPDRNRIKVNFIITDLYCITLVWVV